MAHFSGTISSLLQLAFLLLRLVIEAVHFFRFCLRSYAFTEVGIIVLEGIFLLKRAHRYYLDLAVWVECTFETALEWALQSGQAGLPPAETMHAYKIMYFPAQRLHGVRDHPQAVTDMLIRHDP